MIIIIVIPLNLELQEEVSHEPIFCSQLRVYLPEYGEKKQDIENMDYFR